MKILVTGALGHIGSRLVRTLPFAFPESEIVMVDNLMTQRYCALFNLPSGVSYRFIEEDIRKIELPVLLNDVDVVIHLAAITDAAGSFDKAEIVEENNFDSTRRMAEACARENVRMICISSASVYGAQAETVDENCLSSELNPQSPYAATKLKEERLVQSLSAGKGLRTVIFRFGTIYGVSPGMRFHTAVNKFCWQAIMRTPLTIWKTAYEQRRPYLDLTDAINAIVHVIKLDLFNGEVYNVVTENLTVRDVVETIRMTIPDLEINFVENKIMNQLSYDVLSNKLLTTGFMTVGNRISAISETINLLRNGNM